MTRPASVQGRAAGLTYRRHPTTITMGQQIFAAVAVFLGLAMCVSLFYFLIAGRYDRDREEEAREYFDAHGHWPDEG